MGVKSKEATQRGQTNPPTLMITGKQKPGLGADKLPAYSGLMEEILKDEGFRLNPYKDSRGYVTGGIGHLFTKEDFQNWNPAWSVEEKVDYWTEKFKQDYSSAQRVAERMMKAKGIKDQGEVKDVITNMAYNMGERKLSGFKNFLTALSGDEPDIFRAIYEMKHSKDGKASPWYEQVPERVDKLAERLRGSYEHN